LFIKNLGIILVVFSLTTLFSFALQEFNFRQENILLVYIMGIMIIIVETKKLWYGLISSLFFVILFNFLFIEPRYTFLISDKNYFVSILIFIIVSFIISSLTSRLQFHINTSLQNQSKMEMLYEMSNRLLYIHSVESIANYEMKNLQKYLNKKIIVFLQNKENNQSFGVENFINVEKYKDEINFCLNSSKICGYKENDFPDLSFKIFPLKSNKGNLGVLLVDCSTGNLTENERQFILTVLFHMDIALEREILSEEEQKIVVEMENEKFKTALLRSISHDIRSPLTSLSTGSSLLLDNFDKLDDETKKLILTDINTETLYLSAFVENLLNLTKIDSKNFVIQKKQEVIDDIVSEVVSRTSKKLGNKTLAVKGIEEILFVYGDAQLISQVLVNLVDNAIKHTRDNTKITLTYYQDDLYTWFEVSDNGGGIEKEKIAGIFDGLLEKKALNPDKNRRSGLGLSICKGIVEAHSGKIKAFNNDIGGMTVTFNLPLKKDREKKNE